MPRKEEAAEVDDGVSLPGELEKFLSRVPYSLVVTGPTGTGKTSLALGILRALETKKNLLYISTRIPPAQLFESFGWLGEFYGLNVPSETDEKQPRSEGARMFVDARLDELTTLFERITDELMDAKSPTIVIDSWTDVATMMENEALLSNVRVLQSWRRRANANMIFVTDDGKDSALDFLADGKVRLAQRFVDGRRVRELFLTKLRGVQIERPSYLFTLDKGLFRSFDAPNLEEFGPPQAAKAESAEDLGKVLDKSRIRSGHRELDAWLGGGFPSGSLVELEVGADVGWKVAGALLSNLVLSFVSTANPVLTQSFETLGKEYVSYLKRLEPANGKYLMEADLAGSRGDGDGGASRQLFDSGLLRQVRSARKKYPRKLLLAILVVGPREAKAEARNASEEPFQAAKNQLDLCVLVTRPSRGGLEPALSSSVDIRMKLRQINGTVLLEPVVPWSNFLALVPRRGAKSPLAAEGVSLIPIV
jgi:KaiC/GvpD/RAD55 family RecA-like ATPase